MLTAERRARWATSAALFRDQVWPRICEACGGGRILQVEQASGAPPPALRALDEIAGVDWLQITPANVMYGIASRLQFTDTPYDTFTIRREYVSGTTTELTKRLAARAQAGHEPIGPHWTVQAYASRDGRRLLTAAVVQTRLLLDQVRLGTEGEQWLVRDNGDDASFVYVPWSRFPASWGPFVWREGAP